MTGQGLRTLVKDVGVKCFGFCVVALSTHHEIRLQKVDSGVMFDRVKSAWLNEYACVCLPALTWGVPGERIASFAYLRAHDSLPPCVTCVCSFELFFFAKQDPLYLSPSSPSSCLHYQKHTIVNKYQDIS